MVEMTPVEFVAHATAEVTKAMSEPKEVSTPRLKALLEAVTVFKDNYVDGESESVKVPITFVDSTALKEKQNQLIDPLKAGGASQDQSAFSQGFVSKINSIKNLVEELKAKTPDEPNETGESGATRGGDDDENEKAHKALVDAGLHKAAEAFAKAKKKPEAKTDGDEGADATGATAAEPPEGAPEGEEKGKTKKAVKKGVDKSDDGTAWPNDLNDPAFVKDGKVEKSLDWGND
jgi:hypothetical protein